MAYDLGAELSANPQQMMTQPQPDVGVAPEVLEQNKGLWKSFLDRTRTDPDFRNAVMATGASMMRSPQVGQNGFDQLSNGLTTGMQTLSALQNQRRTQGREDVADAQTAAKTDSSINAETQNAGSYAKTADATSRSVDSNITSDRTKDAVSTANAALQPRVVAADEKRANAAMIAAQADHERAVNPKTGTESKDVALVKMRASSLMAADPALTQDQANLKAQNELLLGKGKTPGQYALDLFKASLDARSSDFTKMGTPMTKQELDAMKLDAEETAKHFSTLGTGTPTSNSSGTINRTGEPQAAAGTTGNVGKKVAMSDGSLAEIVDDSDPAVYVIKLPSGQSARVNRAAADQYIR